MRYCAGTESDVIKIYALGKEMHEESDYRTLDWDREKVIYWLTKNVQDPRRFVMCAYDNDVLAGVFVGSISPTYFGNDLMASDLLWYVGKMYRGSRTGIRLLKMYRSWATDLGASKIKVGISSGMMMDRTGALLERMGFDHIGGLYRATTHD
tara:strand:+ start:2193 stop:2648 length:456 start_codon:yes stop_codon:yes gene_type:complete